jgi:3',5'-cyclic AMP phosphodiesterase CpdA
MLIIVHLSDLHFGRIETGIPPKLICAVAAANPDIVVVSGDLTQRALKREFRDAQQFLASLPHPQVIVPGNHDVPFYNPVLRWLAPLRRYRRFITNDLEPFYADTEIAVLGINTARANTFKNGRINANQRRRSCSRFAACGPDVIRIVVTHHPFESIDSANVVGRAQAAMLSFARSGVDVILSGHLHGSASQDSSARYGRDQRSVLLVQAGTATSTRRRHEVNSFNVLKIDGRHIRIECFSWDGPNHNFGLTRWDDFDRVGESWLRGQRYSA